MSKIHFIKGFVKNFFNKNISLLSFVSADNKIDMILHKTTMRFL